MIWLLCLVPAVFCAVLTLAACVRLSQMEESGLPGEEV